MFTVLLATKGAEAEVYDDFIPNLNDFVNGIKISDHYSFNAQPHKLLANLKLIPNKAFNWNSESLYTIVLDNKLVTIKQFP
jgi:membrane-bound inhibitor of C-type lysozyme